MQMRTMVLMRESLRMMRGDLDDEGDEGEMTMEKFHFCFLFRGRYRQGLYMKFIEGKRCNR